MQVGQGRGGGGGNSRHGRSGGRGGGGGMGRGAGIPPLGYGALPAEYLYGAAWDGYNNYHMPGFYPALPPMRPPNPRGSGGRPYAPLGVHQGGGILKRPASSSSQGAPNSQRRSHSRGHGGRGWAGRNRKNLTKEALDADLDEWRMKDKKLGGQSLDADLDEYWSKKDEDGADELEDAETKDEDLDVDDEKSTISLETETQTSNKKAKSSFPVQSSPGEDGVEKPRDGHVIQSRKSTGT